MPVATGGTLDDWNFAIDILVAAGTVGAVIVALWLGVHAEGDKSGNAAKQPGGTPARS